MISFLFSSFQFVVIGAVMIYFSEQIANFFRDTKSTSLIRGMDNPWTFKALGWMLIIFGPIYVIVSLLLSSMTLPN